MGSSPSLTCHLSWFCLSSYTLCRTVISNMASCNHYSHQILFPIGLFRHNINLPLSIPSTLWQYFLMRIHVHVHVHVHILVCYNLYINILYLLNILVQYAYMITCICTTWEYNIADINTTVPYLHLSSGSSRVCFLWQNSWKGLYRFKNVLVLYFIQKNKIYVKHYINKTSYVLFQ